MHGGAGNPARRVWHATTGRAAAADAAADVPRGGAASLLVQDGKGRPFGYGSAAPPQPPLGGMYWGGGVYPAPISWLYAGGKPPPAG
jgi:hypothetical protein